MGTKVTIDNLASEVKKILDDYALEIDLGVANETELTAKMGARALNSSSKGIVRSRRRKSKSPRYGSSWRVKTERRRLYTNAVIYSGKPGLPHLLEYSHRTGHGGHYSGRTHILPVEQELVETFEDGIIKFIQNH